MLSQLSRDCDSDTGGSLEGLEGAEGNRWGETGKVADRFGVLTEVRPGGCSWWWARPGMHLQGEIGSRSTEGIGGKVEVRHEFGGVWDYGGRTFSRRAYCSRSMRLSFSRNWARCGSVISSRMRPNSANVSKQNRWR